MTPPLTGHPRPAAAPRRAVAAAAPLVVALVLALTGCGSEEPGGATPVATSAEMTAQPGSAPMTDERACATFGDDGVESRLVEVHDDEAAAQELVAEHAGAPAFQQALEDTLELLRSSDGELEGDFLSTACAS